jgi:Xaa-Pro aminopeptidase
MKQDLELLMEQQGTDAIWITGPAQHNPSMVYMTGGGHVTSADLFKLKGQVPFLCHGPMERDEATKSGYSLISYAKYDQKALLAEAGGDQITMSALLYRQILAEIGLTKGKVLLYGVRDVGPFVSVIQKLHEMLPDLTISGDGNSAVLLEARATKDAAELERIRQMGILTTTVVSRTADLLTSHRVEKETLIKKDGTPLTVGAIKSQINLWIAELGGENPEDTIFAIGRDAGVPHSSGTPSDVMRLGTTIVYDIFPCEFGGGYFYDFTRTWSLGYATDEVYKLYDQVKQVYDTVTSEILSGVNINTYQERTCDLFEAMGHTTPRKDPQTTNGYVHSLSHGVGLNIHEKPFCGRAKDGSQVLRPGSVFTVEPGLYYPEKGMGVRLEDTYFVNSAGKIEKFVEYPMNLVLPIKG